MSQDPAEVAKGGEGSNPVLDQLYETLGAVQAGTQARQQEAQEQLERLKKQESDLLQQRQQAEEAGDRDAFDRLTAQLDELRQAWTVLNDEELGGVSRPEGKSVDRDDDRSSRQRGHDQAR